MASERLPHLAEQQRVENPDDGGQHDAPSAAPAIPVAVVCVCRAEREVEKRLGESPLGPYGAFDVFRKFLASAGTDSRKCGCTSRMFCGMFLSVSIGVAPICTVATEAPQAIMM